MSTETIDWERFQHCATPGQLRHAIPELLARIEELETEVSRLTSSAIEDTFARIELKAAIRDVVFDLTAMADDYSSIVRGEDSDHE